MAIKKTTTNKQLELRAPSPEKQARPKIALDEARLAPPPAPPAPPSPLEIKSTSTQQYGRIETIDPSLAKLLLEANVRNRPVSWPHVRRIARDMETGNWRLTHQGIALDRDGRLVDGQHRLHAIVESKTTQRMVVTYNVEPDSFHSIDVAIQPRSIAQVAGLLRGSKYAGAKVAASKVIWYLLEDNREATIRTQWTESEVFKILDVFEPDLHWVAERVNNCNMLKQAPAIAALAFAAPVAREEIADLIARLKSRANMTPNMAACWKGLERVGTAKNHEERITMATMVLKVAMHHVKGENDLTKVYVYTDQPLAQPVYGFFRSRRKKLGLIV